MTNAHEDQSLSRLELVVLARLSSATPPSAAEIAKDVLAIVPAVDSPATARSATDRALAALRDRGLIAVRARSPTGPRTEAGDRALMRALGVARPPTWIQFRDAVLPALGLGFEPGSDRALRALRSVKSLTAALLREQLDVADGATPLAVCDALIAEALGMPVGPLTLDRIRAHVLARRAGIEAIPAPEQLARTIAAKAVGTRGRDKPALNRGLARRWIGADGASAGDAPPADTLLDVVRDAIPRVGAAGRFGAEKVFVSAIWHAVERDRRLRDLSLDRFKRWLLDANREGELDLARADLVGAMDAALVAESEIVDQGATFHFVIDHRGVNGALHAR